MKKISSKIISFVFMIVCFGQIHGAGLILKYDGAINASKKYIHLYIMPDVGAFCKPVMQTVDLTTLTSKQIYNADFFSCSLNNMSYIINEDPNSPFGTFKQTPNYAAGATNITLNYLFGWRTYTIHGNKSYEQNK